MRRTLYAYCEELGDSALLGQWDREKNGALTPRDLSYGSQEKPWWRCENGHEWQATVYSRTAGAGCPYCAGKRIWPGNNDFATLYPALAAEWHPVKNGTLPPNEVSPGSHRKVWWRCEKGHEWRASVKSRTEGCGCPVCANREIAPGSNDLASTAPELARQWHPSRNGALRPEDVVAGSDRRVWWRCEKGHEWRATVSSRSRGSGCPVCSNRLIVPGENDLATVFPVLAAQLDAKRSVPYGAETLSPYSNRKVWWRCEKGHSYAAAVSSRTSMGAGCPYCAGRRVLPGFNDLASREPKLAEQWNHELNGGLTPETVTAGSAKKVWWTCSEGHVWQAVISSRTGKKKSGCPVCAGRYKKKNRVREANVFTEA